MERVVKSVLVTQFGGYESLLITEHPLPKLGDEDVEVDVYYCGINFADLYTRQGLTPKHKMPFVLGMECSGKVTSVGRKSAAKFKVGQRVVCYNYNGGMYRRTVVVPARHCYTIPDTVSLKEAAAMFVNYLTAYFCVMKLGNLRPYQHILINSCAGGVGWAATQLANQVQGVTVYGTASFYKEKEVKTNGVHHVFQYDTYKKKIKEICPSGLDLIIDNQAGENFTSNQELLRSLGKIVLIGANCLIQDENKLTEDVFQNIPTHASLSSLILNSTSVAGFHLGIIAEKEPAVMQEALNKIFSLLSQKKIKPKIDSVWPMKDIVKATKLLQERKNIGKVLLSTGRDTE